MGKWKFCYANFIIEQIWRHFCLVIWGAIIELNTQNFEIKVPKGIFFLDFVKDRPANGFIVFSTRDLVR
jgi:hypothetical protein